MEKTTDIITKVDEGTVILIAEILRIERGQDILSRENIDAATVLIARAILSLEARMVQ